MKKTYMVLLASVLLGFGSVAVADEPAVGPVTLTDAQMDVVVGGSADWHQASVDIGFEQPTSPLRVDNWIYVYAGDTEGAQGALGHKGRSGAIVGVTIKQFP